MVPTEDKVAALVGMCRGDNEPFPPMSPRRVVPTLQSIAANAVHGSDSDENAAIEGAFFFSARELA